MSVFGHNIAVEVAPPYLRETESQSVVWLMVVSKEFSVLAPASLGKPAASPMVETSREMLLHDRVHKSWKRIQVEGTLSRLRLLGPWLATIVGIENPDHKPSPGRENERNQSTPSFPNLRQMYASFAEDNKVLLPGTLVLQNLQDDRKIRIETGQEDSEILWAGDDKVLYRVNDAIYQAGIAGNQIQEPTVIVKDEDAPEVHWVFGAQ